MTNLEKLKNTFVSALNIDSSRVKDSLEYQSIIEWDSVAHLILVSEIEECFDISITIDDITDMTTFAKAKEILSKYDIHF